MTFPTISEMRAQRLAYHFTGDRLRDGRPLPAIGETLVHDGPIVWCGSGLYWSRKPHQALIYAPGPMLSLVRVGGTIIEPDDEDKGASTERTVLARIDATHLLRRFAADQALSVSHLWDMPEVVREYLTTLDESKRTAAWAASDAAWAADMTARAAARVARNAARVARDVARAARVASAVARADLDACVHAVLPAREYFQ